MLILKEDRNSTHHGGIGFPRIVVLAASLDQNNGTIATKKMQTIAITPAWYSANITSCRVSCILVWPPARPSGFASTYVQLDGETAISSPNGLVVHGQRYQNFDLNTCQRNKRAPGVPVQNANQISGFTVPRLVGTLQEKATLSPSDTAIGLDVLPTIHFCLENMPGASSISWMPLVAIKNRNKTRVVHRCEPNDSRIHICHYQAWKLGTGDSRASTYQSFCSVITVISVASRVWKHMLPTESCDNAIAIEKRKS